MKSLSYENEKLTLIQSIPGNYFFAIILNAQDFIPFNSVECSLKY